MGETKLDHAKKCDQMHSLAQHFTKQIAAKVQKDGNKEAYGKMFRYNRPKVELNLTYSSLLRKG